MTTQEAYEAGRREVRQEFITDISKFNMEIVEQYDIPTSFFDNRAMLQTVEMKVDPDDLPHLHLHYVLKPAQDGREFKKARVGKNQSVFTAESVYDRLYNEHYKFLTSNHMSEDRAERLATIHAVENTWGEFNAQSL